MKFGMTELRNEVGESIKIVEEEEKSVYEKKADDAPEFELLESVKTEGVFADDRFVESVVKPGIGLYNRSENNDEKGETEAPAVITVTEDNPIIEKDGTTQSVPVHDTESKVDMDDTKRVYKDVSESVPTAPKNESILSKLRKLTEE
jgi:hypothetical protein